MTEIVLRAETKVVYTSFYVFHYRSGVIVHDFPECGPICVPIVAELQVFQEVRTVVDPFHVKKQKIIDHIERYFGYIPKHIVNKALFRDAPGRSHQIMVIVDPNHPH